MGNKGKGARQKGETRTKPQYGGGVVLRALALADAKDRLGAEVAENARERAQLLADIRIIDEALDALGIPARTLRRWRKTGVRNLKPWGREWDREG